LDILDAGQQLAFADMVAFLDQDFPQLALGVRPNIDVILRLNFARSRD
jgi:hypothetical protein